MHDDASPRHESILKIYFRAFDKGLGHILPPVLIARPKLSLRHYILDRLVAFARAEYQRLFEQVDELGEAFYLMDGVHRGFAAALCHSEIRALELEDDRDLVDLERMVQEGSYFNLPAYHTELPGLPAAETRLSAAVTDLEMFHLREVLTLRKAVDALVQQCSLPAYMVRRYAASRAG